MKNLTITVSDSIEYFSEKVDLYLTFDKADGDAATVILNNYDIVSNFHLTTNESFCFFRGTVNRSLAVKLIKELKNLNHEIYLKEESMREKEAEEQLISRLIKRATFEAEENMKKSGTKISRLIDYQIVPEVGGWEIYPPHFNFIEERLTKEGMSILSRTILVNFEIG